MAEFLRLSATVRASRQQIFAAMTTPEQVAQWWGPHGFTCPEVSLDVRPGGGYRIAMQPPGGDAFHLLGTYEEVVPPSLLVYTFRWTPPDPDDRDTRVRVSLREVNGSTEVVVEQGPFATPARLELHRSGWTDSLARLSRHLTAG